MCVCVGGIGRRMGQVGASAGGCHEKELVCRLGVACIHKSCAWQNLVSGGGRGRNEILNSVQGRGGEGVW